MKRNNLLKILAVLCSFFLLIGCGNGSVSSDSTIGASKQNSNAPTLVISKPKNKVLIDYADLEDLTYYEAKKKLESLGFDENYYDGMDYYDGAHDYLSPPKEYDTVVRQGIWCEEGKENIPGAWKIAVWDHSISLYGLKFGEYTDIEDFATHAGWAIKKSGRWYQAVSNRSYAEYGLKDEQLYIFYLHSGVFDKDDVRKNITCYLNGFIIS